MLFSDGEFTAALMLDSVGAVAVKSLADLVNYSICQEVLFRLCDAERINVIPTAQYMMVPRKSVSLCIGIGRESVGDARVNSCHRCNMVGCQYRKEGEDE